VNDRGVHSSPSPEPRLIREHLAAVVSSAPFARSRRLQRFLEYVVERELAGQRDDIQEYAIGLEVFDRGESFDPRSDSIVRVEARRLRQRLADYYAGDGRRERIRIVLPRRGYVPSFEHRRIWPVWAMRTAAIAIAVGIVVIVSYGVYRAPWRTSPSAVAPPGAREAFEKGMTAFEQWTADGARQAEAFFQEAAARDPEYARAYAWLGAAYRQRALMGDANSREANLKSLEAARKAVALDSSLAEAHEMLAVALTFEPRWLEAEAEFQTAIRIDPDNASAHHAYGITLLAASRARLAEAESELRSAVRLEPGELAHRVVLAKVLYFRGRLTEARATVEEAVEIDPQYPDAMRNLAAVLVLTGEYARAVRLYEEAQQLAYLPWGDGLLGHALAVSGDRPRARALLAALESRYGAQPTAALAMATVQLGLQEWDAACNSLQRAWNGRQMRARYIDVDPVYAPMRDQPCFRELVDQMALADLSASH
jgi:tetratricopeptide (TPR) repeat protein